MRLWRRSSYCRRYCRDRCSASICWPCSAGRSARVSLGERTLAFTFAGLVVGSVLSATTTRRPANPQRLYYNGRPTARCRGHSARLSVICLLYGCPAFGTTGFSYRCRAWLCAYDRRIRGRTDDRRQHSRAYEITVRRSVRLHQRIALGQGKWVAGGMLVFAFAVILILTSIDKYVGRRST